MKKLIKKTKNKLITGTVCCLCLFLLAGCGTYSLDDMDADSDSFPDIQPSVASIVPDDGQRDVSTDILIVATFNKALMKSTISSDAIMLRSDTEQITGNIEYNENDKSISFTPENTLEYATDYTIEISSLIRDDDGNPVQSGSEFTFRTVSQPILQLSAGFNHTCVLLKSRKVKCWGRNNSGALGLGHSQNIGDDTNEMGSSLETTSLGNDIEAQSVEASYGLTCALLADKSLKCWGINSDGQLGQNDTTARGDDQNEMGSHLSAIDLGTGETVQSLATGQAHVCAILTSGKLKCWGSNAFGNLGLELPQGGTDLTGTYSKGDGKDPNNNDAVEMGDNLPNVDLGSNIEITALSAGANHTCALLDNKKIKCWGRNYWGTLGLGLSNSECMGDESSEMGDNLPYVNLGTNIEVEAVTSKQEHTCVLTTKGQIKCWGLNDYGELGLGDGRLRGNDSTEMGDALPTVDLGSGRTAKAVAVGGYHTCAILDDNSVKCWGRNNYGQLGLGHTTTIGDNEGEMGDNLPTVDLGTGRTAVAISLGSYHSCAELDNGAVKCWGNNSYGQLGLGDTINRGDEPDQMGDTLLSVDLGSE